MDESTTNSLNNENTNEIYDLAYFIQYDSGLDTIIKIALSNNNFNILDKIVDIDSTKLEYIVKKICNERHSFINATNWLLNHLLLDISLTDIIPYYLLADIISKLLNEHRFTAICDILNYTNYSMPLLTLIFDNASVDTNSIRDDMIKHISETNIENIIRCVIKHTDIKSLKLILKKQMVLTDRFINEMTKTIVTSTHDNLAVLKLFFKYYPEKSVSDINYLLELAYNNNNIMLVEYFVSIGANKKLDACRSNISTDMKLLLIKYDMVSPGQIPSLFTKAVNANDKILLDQMFCCYDDIVSKVSLNDIHIQNQIWLVDNYKMLDVGIDWDKQLAQCIVSKDLKTAEVCVNNGANINACDGVKRFFSMQTYGIYDDAESMIKFFIKNNATLSPDIADTTNTRLLQVLCKELICYYTDTNNHFAQGQLKIKSARN